MNVIQRSRAPLSVPDRPPVPPWLLKLLAVPAGVAVWSGWVGVGQMTGFGLVRPLPGIWSSLRIDTAFTLPVGIEAYAVLSMRAWLTRTSWVSARTRRFAFWSAMGSLVLGMAGQAAYHLLTQSGMTRAPWLVTTLVSCLPVLVLGLGAVLAHMMHADAEAAHVAGPDQAVSGRVCGPVAGTGDGGPVRGDAGSPDQPLVREPGPDDGHAGPGRDSADQHGTAEDAPWGLRLMHARSVAAELAAAGQRVSRRTLRAAGVRGSNAELAVLAREVDPARIG